MRLIGTPDEVFREYHAGSLRDPRPGRRRRCGRRPTAYAPSSETRRSGECGGEGLDDRDVDPDLLAGGRQDELEAGAEPGAGAGDPAGRPRRVRSDSSIAHAPAEELDLELDGRPHAPTLEFLVVARLIRLHHSPPSPRVLQVHRCL